MEEIKVEIGQSLRIGAYKYETLKPDVFFSFTERSPDSWYSDTETTVDVDEAKAREIITFLMQQVPAILGSHL